MEKMHYLLSSSSFGDFALVWEAADQPRILRVYLPGESHQLEEGLLAEYPGCRRTSSAALAALAGDIRRFLDGEDVLFDLQQLAWEQCTEFQASVLRAEAGIPRGWVSTYGRIASFLGFPRASRAVGNALASNPFPLLVPCHRAVRSTGELGGYQGGLGMKKALLELEGVAFRSPYRVSLHRVYYS